ncbi:MAG: molybdopterin molybdotransferase MoeA [Planctomycetales bacterium]|nr:molybdopterin molybdotransferase MoeA [Planctomycetales bacterium]
MLSINEAQELIAAEIHSSVWNSVESVPLGEALGHILAQDIVSDIDSPPHDKSIVDGYAVAAEGLSAGAELPVLEEVTAGAVPTREITTGTATRIMTGAPLPSGATAVVMVEKTENVSDKRDMVRLLEMPRGGQNIVRKGTSLRQGETVLKSGSRLSPARIGLLAEVGCSSVKVAIPPTVAVLTTGNEIVPVDAAPGPGQIRNSNGPMLEAMVNQLGAKAISLGVARDEREALAELVRRGLEADFLVLSGGVSAGVLDLVPGVLAELGVRPVFHKVNLKPGKPIWFGVFERREGNKTLVFGLPGNPVSSFVCFELFVRFALSCIQRDYQPESLAARLAADHHHRGDRPTYWPATLAYQDTAAVVTLLPWKGSGDLKTLADADCLACFPGEERPYKGGEAVKVHVI